MFCRMRQLPLGQISRSPNPSANLVSGREKGEHVAKHKVYPCVFLRPKKGNQAEN
ncbi:hypothetical protein PAENIP36_70790 [Paenibacillus sp. P36]